jgi:hypothetical protein
MKHIPITACTTIAIAVGAVFALLLPPSALAAGTNAPVIVICNTIGYPPPPPPGQTFDFSPPIVAALWDDGRIVWSETGIGGGPPLRQGQFAPEKLKSLLGSLVAQGAFTNAALRRTWTGPDSQTTKIVINDGPRRLRMESWHELFESNTNLIVTAQSVASLNGRDREAVQREQPEAYRQFRSTWKQIRDAVASLIPAKGEPFNGKVPIPEN